MCLVCIHTYVCDQDLAKVMRVPVTTLLKSSSSTTAPGKPASAEGYHVTWHSQKRGWRVSGSGKLFLTIEEALEHASPVAKKPAVADPGKH